MQPLKVRRDVWRLLASLVLVGTAAYGAAAQGRDLLQDARAAMGRGDVKSAMVAVDAVLAREPRNKAALTIKIEALGSASDWETALDAYDRFINAGGGEDHPLLRAIGRAYLREAVAFYPSLRLQALGRLACGGDRDALRDLRRAPEPVRKEDVETLLLKARLGETDSLVTLRAIAATAPAGLRVAALQALVQLRDRSAEPVVLAALGQPEPFLRMTAARAARLLAVEAARPTLEQLTRDQNALVSAEALAALAVLGSADAFERLEPMLAPNTMPELRVSALAAALARAPDPALLDALSAMALNRSGLAWSHAVELLLAHDAARAKAAISAALDDPNPNTRVTALRLAARVPMTEEDDLARLRAQMRDNNGYVRLEAATALVGTSTLCE